MSDELTITVTDEDAKVPVKVLKVEGEINSITFQNLKDKADEVIDEGAKYLLLDFKAVTFMSSAGFRAIHHIYLRLTGDISDALISEETKSPYIKLAHVSESIQKVLRATGLDSQIEIFNSQVEAMASY